MHLGHSLRRSQRWTFSVIAGTAILSLPALVPSALVAATQTPRIELTYVPAYGSSDALQGRVSGVEANGYAVAVYSRVPPYGWSTKPTTTAPMTRIAPDGTWTCAIVTGPNDAYAIEIVAFLIPAGYTPPALDAAAALPEVLYACPYAEATRYPRLRFANSDWMVKRVNEPVNPGPNYFGDDPENLWVDEAGQLHLRLTRRSGQWYCSEIIAARTLGYGRYALTVTSGIRGLDRNAVLGFFTWDDRVPDYNYREMDVEISRWGDDRLPNARFLVQPWYNASNLHQFEVDPTADPNGVTTHEFTWDAAQVRFRSYYGPFVLSPPADRLIASWRYHGADLPHAGKENLHLSLWLISHLPPADGKPVEVTIGGVTYLPCDPNAVHRFWSPALTRHFFTISPSEKEKLQRDYPQVWTYEGIAYWAPAQGGHPDLAPVHRFWSDRLADHFYTIDEAEKDRLIAAHRDIWTYEGVAFYAWPEGRQPPGSCPVYRFWSGATGSHFYTAQESEKDKLIREHADLWTYEGIAWHAYAASVGR
jgi:hypothetical protein